MILFTPIRRMMLSSRNIRRRLSRGTIRFARRNGSPGTKDQSFSQIRRPSGSWRFLKSSGSSCDFWMRPGGSVAMGIGGRRERCWQSEMWRAEIGCYTIAKNKCRKQGERRGGDTAPYPPRMPTAARALLRGSFQHLDGLVGEVHQGSGKQADEEHPDDAGV